MKNHIAEDLPARKFAPAAAGAAPAAEKKENRGKTPEDRAKQAVYDIRYKARREDIPLRQAYSEYMQNSSMGGQERNIVKQRLFGKEGGGMRAEDFNPIFKNAASDNVAKALFKVFVEKKEINIEDLKEFYTRRNSRGEIVFHVRITDKKTGNSYTRDATREKLNKLRANPNIDIEMSEYRKDSEIERTKGALTAKVAAGRGLDPVGQEDGDINNNGIENDKSDKYLMKRRGAIGNAIATRKEEFIHEAETEDSNNEKIDVMKKGKKNNCKVYDGKGGGNNMMGQGLMNHQELEGELIAETGYSKFLKKVHSLQEKAVSQNQQQLAGMALAYLRGEMPDASEEVKKMAKMGEKKLRDFAKTKHEGLPEKVKEEMECGSDDKKKKNGEEEDPRSMKTKVNLVKNKLRAMGLKMSYEPEGEVIDEAAQRIRRPRQSANPRGTYDTTGIGQYPRTEKERKKMREGEPVGKYRSLEREPEPMIDDENPPRRRYRGDDHPSLTARERNPGLR
jgi:hypothetical protein